MLAEGSNDRAVLVSGVEEVLNIAIQAYHHESQLEQFGVGGVCVDGKRDGVEKLWRDGLQSRKHPCRRIDAAHRNFGRHPASVERGECGDGGGGDLGIALI